ncbi:MAG: TetR/AcrR family transcriptional regulator [Eubacteriales bacterium]|nr:TetR/AcrR family transcriptional regulator [Eubacteriales bacterium]
MKSTRPASDEIKPALTRIAKSLFLRNGITATEMKSIAAEAGLSRSTLYRYIPDKNQLAFLIASEVLQDLTNQNIAFVTNSSLNGYEKLCEFTHHFTSMLCNNIEIVSFLSEFDSIFRGDYPDIPEANEYMETINRMLHRTAQFLFEGLADGSIRPLENPLFYTSILINTLFGLAERMLPRAEHYQQEHQASAEKVLLATADILLAHIRK